MPHDRSRRFEADIVLGHKGVVTAMIPFDPEEAFGRKPVRLAGRRHGWLVEGTLNGVAFEGYVGERWGRFFVMLDDALRERAGVTAAQPAALVLRPTSAKTAFAKALEQSLRTTQPAKARADAVVVKA